MSLQLPLLPASDGTPPAEGGRNGHGAQPQAEGLATSWFKFPVNYWEEKRMFDLRRLLGDAALWIPARLWSFAVVQGGSDDMSVYQSCELAEALRYKGPPEGLMAALTQAGYLDKDGRIVGWNELYALAASRKRSAAMAANARWSQHTQDPDGLKNKEKKERGDAHAVRDAMRDASPPPPAHYSSFALPEAAVGEIAREYRLTLDGVREAEKIFRENKANFPRDPATIDAFRGWLRVSAAARAIREKHRAAAAVAQLDPADDVPEPEGWHADVWDDPEIRKMTQGITEWERLGAARRPIAEAIARRRATVAAG